MSSYTVKEITQVSLMTFSNVVISTSVKIWSISGMSLAPLEAKEEKISLGQRNRKPTERGLTVSAGLSQEGRVQERSLEENAGVVEEIIQS